MNTTIAVLVAYLLFNFIEAAAPLACARTVQQSRVAEPETNWREIKSLAQAEVASPPNSFPLPGFSIKQVGSTTVVTISKSKVGDLGFGMDPYRSPFGKQILIESIRRSLTEARLLQLTGNDPAKQELAHKVSEEWQSYLNQAELTVKQMVVAIETIPDKSQLRESLTTSEKQVDDLLYGKFFGAVEKYAEENKYSVVYERGGVKPFSVPIVSVPEGAKIWLMTDIVYQKQKMFKIDSAHWPWQEIVQNPVDLIGKYRYLARWPDGKYAEGPINITSGSTLTFRPN